MRYLLLTILLSMHILGQAQSAPEDKMTLSGKVTESFSGQPVPGANIVIKSNNRMKGFVASDAEGNFSISILRNLPDPTLTVSAVGYKTYTAPLDTTRLPLSVILEDGAMQLKEVVVKSRAITGRGDTLTYNVSSFAQTQDRSIGDVLKRMPGIDVEENGKIKYQGTDINKFYIEGSDLLGGKYGIATNGIDHQDVGAVEVMENHQPIRVLQGYAFSEQPAINLKLKNRAKATLAGHGTLGGGWATLPHGAVWNADLFGMMVTGKYQNITTFKANNNGVRVADQLTQFYADFSDEDISPYLSLSPPSPPQLRSKSTYLNRSWMVSVNNLWKTGDGSEMKLQIDYLNDRVTAAASSLTTYILPEGEQIVAEDRTSLSHNNALTAKLSAEINRKTFYLTDILDADFSWKDSRLDVAGTLNNSQTARTPDFHVINLLKVMKRFGKGQLVTFKSRNEWHSLPERLSVMMPDGAYGENIRQYSFYTDERASFGFPIKKIMVEMEGGIAGFFRTFSAHINDVDLGEESFPPSLSTNYLRLFLSPNFKWSLRRLDVQLKIPLDLYSYFLSPTLSDRSEFFFHPSLTLQWRPFPGATVSLNGNLSHSPSLLHSLYPFPVLTDYRHIATGTSDNLSSSAESVSLRISWRHIPTGIFLNAMASHRWNHSGYETVQDVEDDFVFTSYRKTGSSGRMTVVRADISTNLDFMKGIAGVRGNGILNDSRLISQNVPSTMSTRILQLTPFVNGSVGGYANWDLRFSWSRSTMRLGSLSPRHADSFIWHASLTLTPLTWFTWHTSLDHYRMQTAGGFVNMPMLDSKLTFRLSKRIELTADVTNILDKKGFSYSYYGTATQIENHSTLRGREFLLSITLKK